MTSGRAQFQGIGRAPHAPAPRMQSAIEWVIDHSGGYIKTEKQALFVIVGFAALVIVIFLFLFSDGSGGRLTPEEERFLNVPAETI